MKNIVLLFFFLVGGLAQASHDLIINNAALISHIDGQMPRHVNVLIIDGKINQISAARIEADRSETESPVPTIDAEGLFLTPGLMDSHVHVSGVPGMGFWGNGIINRNSEIAEAFVKQQPRSLLYYGVTQILDPNPGLAKQHFLSTPQRPDYFHCEVLGTPETYPMVELETESAIQNYPYFILDKPLPDRLKDQYPASEHTPEVVVERLAKSGASCVKIFIENGFGDSEEWSLMTPEIMHRISSASEKHQLPVFVHANALDMLEATLAHPPTAIIHGPWNWDLETRLSKRNESGLPPKVQQLLDKLHSENIVVSPTFRTIGGLQALMLPETLNNPAWQKVTPQSLLDWYQKPESLWFKEILFQGFGGELSEAQIAEIYQRLINQNRSATRYLYSKGHTLQFGSDTPGSPSYGNQPGLASYQELVQLQLTGFSLSDIFKTATLGNAQILNIDKDYGSVEVGKVANLLLLKKNPLETIEAWDSIETVILHGEPIMRESLSAGNDN